MKILSLLALLLSIPSFSQCKDSDKLFSPVKERINDKYIFFAVNDKYSNSHNISSIANYANGAISASAKYIKQRSGAAFEKKCKLKYIYVNYPEGMNKKSPTTELYNLSKYKVSYTIHYTVPYGKHNYDFQVLLDHGYNILSGYMIPSIADNPKFEKFIDVCVALKVVKSQKLYKGVISGIGIIYHPEVHVFCWHIQEEPASLNDSENYYTRDYYINANTGKLETVEDGELFLVEPEEPKH